MARRVEWTTIAKKTFKDTLKYYTRRNGSSVYSRKLKNGVKETLVLLKRFPLLGRPAPKDEIRIITRGHYNLYYRVYPRKIVILHFWDTRRNPNDLPDL